MRAFLLACCLLTPASAETLRPFVLLQDPVVRLSDLFAGAVDRVLATAPPPGQRIVVEAAQLAAIARQFGVDWRPASSADRAVLERAARAMSAAEVTELLRPALLAAGAPVQSEIELPAFVPPMVPPHDAATRIVQLDYDASNGRFAATLSTASGDVQPGLARVSGRVQETIEVLVPTRRILAAEPIAAGDLRALRAPASSLTGEVVHSPEQAVALASRRMLQPGQPILVADLSRAVVVVKGSAVLMSLDSPGITLSAQGIAAEPGGVGDRIRVVNPASKSVVLAEVTGPGRARVMPGTSPVSTAARTQVAVR